MNERLKESASRTGLPDGEPREATAEPAIDEVAESTPSFCIVGVGASAGGLEALESFFTTMPSDAGAAFVVIQHLSPDFKSLMDELLSRRTEIAIHRVEDNMVVEPNAIYLIPPKKEMIISGGRLLLTDKDPATGLSLPIDTFFRSLAQDAGSRAVAIVLSGTGSDGSRGVRAVHEAGGLVMVQSEESAKFDGMPRSAIETGIVDLILSPAELAKALVDYVEHPVPWPQQRSPDRPSETGINAVYDLLRNEFAIDFSHYKPSTVLRRIERRLQLNRSLDLDQYVGQLRADGEELNRLYKDLLIGVTRFFRDPSLFDRLTADVIPEVLSRVPPEGEIRAWVAGCATGEEAYSLAIVLHEALLAARRPVNVKIFATDVHRASLERGSLGVYEQAALVEVSPERLSRYFSKHADGYQVSQDLRKMIVFAPHNLIKDAPFTRLDLVSCRNLLIYLQTHAQKKAISLFHFGLKTRGVLVLGPSESPGEIADEFETIDSHWKIYRKRRDVRLPTEMRLQLTPMPPPVQTTSPAPRPALSEPHLIKVYDELLAAYTPPSLLVGPHRELLHAFAGAGKLLSIPDGRPSRDVLDLVDAELRLAISGALQRATKEGVTIAYGGVVRRSAGGEQSLKVSVRPLSLRGLDTYFLVSLEPEVAPMPQAESVGYMNVDAESRQRVGELEDEVRYAKENLQSAVEELETTNEELQATNEELVASNEELQSTNEELHSVNEELYTVNAEHRRKIAELVELTDDMDNLLRSTELGTIFLDRDLFIRKFTPQIAHAFQLLPQDVGRRIDSFAHNILHPGLLDDVRNVLNSGMPLERDVQDRLGQWFLLRVLPYRSHNQVEGVVVTLVNISRRKLVEHELKQMSKVFIDGADPIIVEDIAGRIINLNREAERAYGWSREELLGQSSSVLVPRENGAQFQALRDRCRVDDSIRNVESVRQDRTGRASPVLLTLSLLHDEAGHPAAIASISKDITSQKKAEKEARDAANRRDQFLAMLSHELRNPLGAIMNATHVFERAAGDGEIQREACAAIQRQAKQMGRLLDDLLDVARVTQGKIHIRSEIVDLRSLVLEAVQAMQPLVESHKHSLKLDLPEGPVHVAGDPARLLQVEQNLLANAVKYTPPGGTLRVALREDNAQAVLSIEDNGLGIAPEMRGKIFELFVQAPQKLERIDSGMGIGLTMVQTIVQLHGGSVSVESDGLGKGSRFEVRLPLSNKLPEPRPTPHPTDGALKVVIVEDNSDSRKLLETLLRLDGHEVTAAADGISGYEAIAERKPDVALVDIGLPGINGYELARKVRAEMADVPIRLVALTGYGRSVDRVAVFEAGFNEHLVKPVASTELAKAMQKPR